MPFKTRRQKVSAQIRRFATVESGLAVYKPEARTSAKESKIEAEQTKTLGENYTFIRQDLVKIALVASIILTAQLALKFLFKNTLTFSFIS